MIRSDRFPTCSGVITSELMSPAAWDHAVAKAERAGGPLHGELVRLAQRFDAHGSVGHGVATCLMMLSACAREAETGYEVQVSTARIVERVAAASFESRLQIEPEGPLS
jgi:hypothetical protein